MKGEKTNVIDKGVYKTRIRIYCRHMFIIPYKAVQFIQGVSQYCIYHRMSRRTQAFMR